MERFAKPRGFVQSDSSPGHPAGFFLEIIGRSMFMTVLGADVFMRMNLSTWQHHRTLAGSSAAEGYDRVMGAMEQISE